MILIGLPLFLNQTQCKIEFDKERRQFFICDVGSRNGTFLNGVRLSEVHVICHGGIANLKMYSYNNYL